MVFWNNNRTRNHDDPMKASPPKNEFKIPGHAEARCGALRAGPPCCARQEGGHEARQGLSFQSGVQGFEIRVQFVYLVSQGLGFVQGLGVQGLIGFIKLLKINNKPYYVYYIQVVVDEGPDYYYYYYNYYHYYYYYYYLLTTNYQATTVTTSRLYIVVRVYFNQILYH